MIGCGQSSNKLVEERLDHTRQMEGLLLSIARGYASADIEKYGLPELETGMGYPFYDREDSRYR